LTGRLALDFLAALADRGYFNGEQVLACEKTGVLPCIPTTDTSRAANRGLFTRHYFIYDAKNDHYTCPAGQQLTKSRRRPTRQDGMDDYRHLTACFTCQLRQKCTPDSSRGSAAGSTRECWTRCRCAWTECLRR
jgi:hypothetical protein